MYNDPGRHGQGGYLRVRSPEARPCVLAEQARGWVAGTYDLAVSTRLETTRLVIRTFGARDAGPWLAMVTDPDVTRFLPAGPAPTMERAQNVIEKRQAQERELGYSMWAVEDKTGARSSGNAACGRSTSPRETGGDRRLPHETRQGRWLGRAARQSHPRLSGARNRRMKTLSLGDQVRWSASIFWCSESGSPRTKAGRRSPRRPDRGSGGPGIRPAGDRRSAMGAYGRCHRRCDRRDGLRGVRGPPPVPGGVATVAS
jgi:hypothetical protein